MVPLQLRNPLGLFKKRGKFLYGSWFISSHNETIAVESDVKS